MKKIRLSMLIEMKMSTMIPMIFMIMTIRRTQLTHSVIYCFHKLIYIECFHRTSFVRSISLTGRPIMYHGGRPSYEQRSHTRNAIHYSTENRRASRSSLDSNASSSSSTTSSGKKFMIPYSFNLKLFILNSSMNVISRYCKKTMGR